MNYDALIITNLPNYYKVNLFNKIAEDRALYVVFIASKVQNRNEDFLSIQQKEKFDYIILSESLESRNSLKTCLKLLKIIRTNSFGKLLVGEWVNLEYWFALLFFRRKNTLLTLESNVHSVHRIGIKEWFKKLFLSKIGTVLVSGQKHRELLHRLGYRGLVSITKGVGIIHYGSAGPSGRTEKFLYVGRLSEDKNLTTLIKAFNELPYELSLVGEGVEKEHLRSISGANIQFHGYVNNADLHQFYSSHRALLLVSTHEPFGLVAEEALYFGTPIIASSVCGVVDTLCFNEVNSLVVDAGSITEIRQAVLRMMDDEFYMALQQNCGSTFIIDKDQQQVALYLENI